MEEDEIVVIPKTMEKFFGCSGKMVKPSIKTVKQIVEQIPKGKLYTLEQIKEKLAFDFNVQTACPASINKALLILSKEEKPICYWRVIKKKGELISKFPDGVEGHGLLLEIEGFEIDTSKKYPIVFEFRDKLAEI